MDTEAQGNDVHGMRDEEVAVNTGMSKCTDLDINVSYQLHLIMKSTFIRMATSNWSHILNRVS